MSLTPAQVRCDGCNYGSDRATSLQTLRMIDDASEIVKTYAIDGFELALLRGYRRAPCALTISRIGETAPCAVIVAERNRMARLSGTGTHFICLQDGDRHINYGSSDVWAELEKFEAEALKIAADWLEGQVRVQSEHPSSLDG